MKRLLLAITTSCSLCTGHAQVLDTAALGSFSAGAVAKVFAIAKYTRLTKQQQSYLAWYYSRADSTVKAWIMQGRPTAQIDSLQNKSDQLFYEMNSIDDAVKKEFAVRNAEKFAQTAAAG